MVAEVAPRPQPTTSEEHGLAFPSAPPLHRPPNVFGLSVPIMSPVPKTTRSPDSRSHIPGEAERSYSYYYLYDPTASSQKHHPMPNASNEHYIDYTSPWQDVAYAFSWVQEHQIEEMMRQNQETVEWVLRQQQRFVRDQVSYALDDMHRCFEMEMEMDTESWLEEARETSARRARRKARREAETAKLLQREAEKRKKEHEERHRKVKAVVKARKVYEEQWARISRNPEGRLSFATIPWPTVAQPTNTTGITKDNIREFLLSHHSKDVSSKDRIRTALKLWHPDKFKRTLDRVEGEDRALVEEAAGAVARCLNGLMEEIQTSH